MNTYTNQSKPNKIYKDCESCGDLFEPVGEKGCPNAYCGDCENALPWGTKGIDENGHTLYWVKYSDDDQGYWTTPAIFAALTK